MRIPNVVAVLLVALFAAAAQQPNFTINTETPEGKLLQGIGVETDAAKKLALMEEFSAKYPKHEGAAWVFGQMVPAYTAAGQYDKALEAGAKALAADPADLATAHACLKAAEAKKDPDQVLKWSNATSAIARKIASEPQPKDEDQVDAWKRRVDYARQMDVYTEYSLYAEMLQTADPQKKIALGDALEQRNPQSQYLAQMAEPRFLAYLQARESDKAIALAERTLEKDQSNPEMLLAVADSYRAKKQAEKVAELSKKAIAAAEARPKPEGAADADWQAWKTQVTGRAHWILGLTYAGESRWAETDRELREALPGVQNSKDMMAQALFYLGLSNYRLAEKGQTERARDAVKFSEECAAIPGPLQTQARTNVKAIRAQYRIK